MIISQEEKFKHPEYISISNYTSGPLPALKLVPEEAVHRKPSSCRA